MSRTEITFTDKDTGVVTSFTLSEKEVTEILTATYVPEKKLFTSGLRRLRSNLIGHNETVSEIAELDDF